MSLRSRLAVLMLLVRCLPAAAESPACTPDGASPCTTAPRIHDIQGRTHRSGFEAQRVAGVTGIVTTVSARGFFMQDPAPDDDPASSEGIFVYTNTAPTVAVGDSVVVGGTVTEYRPAGVNGLTHLSATEIAAPSVRILSRHNSLPAAVVLGAGGIPLPRRLYGGEKGDVEIHGRLRPGDNLLDLLESLEGMRVQINDALVCGPTNPRGELAVLPDGGADAPARTRRGGLLVTAGAGSGNRILVTKGLVTPPQADVGDRFARVVGVLDYRYGNYKLIASELAGAVRGGLQRETAPRPEPTDLAIASFNVENLSPRDPPARFDRLATQIVRHLRSPDVLALMELQDDSGPRDDGTVDAGTTLQLLSGAIRRAGGPAYESRQINPENNRDGGQPGGNIRNAFLFNPERVRFVDRPGGSATRPVTLQQRAEGWGLSESPGRIDPQNPAFESSRKPLIGEFVFQGRRLVLIANHWISRRSDSPVQGRFQPPLRNSEGQRKQQAGVIAGFIKSLRAADRDAKLVVLGDFNDFESSSAIGILKKAGLVDLIEQLPAADRYTYVFEGGAQALDHILVSRNLARQAAYSVLHINSEFADQASDHDPGLVRLHLAPPTPATR